MINKLICVCRARDLSTFRTSVKYINQNIDARNYVVFVPESELNTFKKYDLNNFEVINENKYRYIYDYLNKKIGINHRKIGWYFQQFIKIAELRTCDKDEINLIWDSDSVPLKKITFNKNNKLIYYQGVEFHKPYFDLIEKLFDTHKLSKGSFIAQCFPCKGAWIDEFVETLESKFNRKWYEAIIDHIDFENIHAFSEYETLGTYLMKYHRSEIEICNSQWSRYGNSLIGGVDNIFKYDEYLSKKYDFVAFESWDLPKNSFKYKYYKIRNLIFRKSV